MTSKQKAIRKVDAGNMSFAWYNFKHSGRQEVTITIPQDTVDVEVHATTPMGCSTFHGDPWELKGHVKMFSHRFQPKRIVGAKIRKFKQQDRCERLYERFRARQKARAPHGIVKDSTTEDAPRRPTRPSLVTRRRTRASRWDRPASPYPYLGQRPAPTGNLAWRKPWNPRASPTPCPPTPGPETEPKFLFRPPAPVEVKPKISPAAAAAAAEAAPPEDEQQSLDQAHQEPARNEPAGKDPGAACTKESDSDSLPELVSDVEDTMVSRSDEFPDAMKCWKCGLYSHSAKLCEQCEQVYGANGEDKMEDATGGATATSKPDSPASPPPEEQGVAPATVMRVNAPLLPEEQPIEIAPPIMLRGSWTMKPTVHMDKDAVTVVEPPEEHNVDLVDCFYQVSLQKDGFIGEDVVRHRNVPFCPSPFYDLAKWKAKQDAANQPNVPANADAENVAADNTATKNAAAENCAAENDESPLLKVDDAPRYLTKTVTFNVPGNLPIRKRYSRRLRKKYEATNTLDLDPKVCIKRLPEAAVDKTEADTTTETEPDSNGTDQEWIIIE